jgi:hypothetical protein
MNQPNVDLRRTKVTMNDILDKIDSVKYTVLDGTTTTVCLLTMKNGYAVLGTSACADPAAFNAALGEQYSYQDAVNNVWPLEAYLLREEMSKETT